MTRRSQQVAAAGVLVIAAVAFVILRDSADGPTIPAQAPSNSAGRGGAADPSAPVVDLKLDRLQRDQEELPDVTRDPFRFRSIAPPPPPPRPIAPPREMQPEGLLPPVPQGPPPPPPIAVKFFGLVVLDGQRVATFSDTRGNTFYGKEGDIIEGRYRVLRVGTDSVELGYLDGRGRQTIRLTGQ